MADDSFETPENIELAPAFKEKLHHKLLMLKFLPEVEAMRAGKIKGLKGKEIDEFFRGLKIYR